ncbi:MAG: hypothetical protein HFH68_00615 [Lachnospiraceae bacterium]|nr:hypothetical protein [Lachnospiraceae bacterium]
MEKNKIIMLCQVIRRIIDENQLSEAAEAEILEIMEEKKSEDEKICMASVIEKELEKAIKSGQICESYVELYQSVFEKSIRNSEAGNLPSAELSEIIIRKFVLKAEKVYKMNGTRLKCFTGMVQTGLNKMAKDGMLDFVPDSHVYKNYLMCPDREIWYIDNPYTNVETVKIKEWIALHPYDTRSLALGLWFTGDFSLLEIANLKNGDCCNGIFRNCEKAGFVTKALELHPENGSYVFMIINDGKWEKLTAQGLQLKLYHICNRLGIGYKKINRNEMMIYEG